MNLNSIVLQNIMRRKSRVLLVLAALITGIAIAVALYLLIDSMKLALGDQIDEYGANIVIVPQAEGLEIGYGGALVARTAIDLEQLQESDLDVIKTIPDYSSINVVSPKIVAAVRANEQEVIMVGVDPRREFIMKPWFSLDSRSDAGQAGGYSSTDLALLELPDNGLIVGADAAEAFNLQSGDRVEINSELFFVTGILSRLGSVEDGLLFGNLTAVQNLLGRPGEISMVEISAYCNSCPIEEIAAQLSEALPHGRVTALRQAALLREEALERFSHFSLLVASIILVIAGLIVFTVMMSSVYEKTREIGIFRAIGFRSSHIMQIILTEAAFIGLVGGLAGYAGGSLFARYLGANLIGSDIVLTSPATLIMSSAGIAVAVTIAAASYPAYKAASLDPAEALRFI